MTLRNKKIQKTTMLASLIFVLAISVSGIDSAFAVHGEPLTTDELLMESVHQRLLLPDNGVDDPQLIVDLAYLNNDLGVWHSSQEDPSEAIEGVIVVAISETPTVQPIVIGASANSQTAMIDSFSISSNDNGIQTDDTVCSACGTTHDRNLKIKSMMKWPDPHFGNVYIFKAYGQWSGWTSDTATSMSQLDSSSDANVTPYVLIKTDHVTTTATFTIKSHLETKLTDGTFVDLQTPTTKTYNGIDFATKATVKSASFDKEPLLTAYTKHTATIDISSIAVTASTP